MSALYSAVSNSEILKTGGGVVAVEMKTLRISVVVSTGASGGVFRRQSRVGESFLSSGEVEGGASFLRDHTGAASDLGTKTPCFAE